MKPVIFDTRSIFDKGWHAAMGGGALDGMTPHQVSNEALGAVLAILCPLLGPGSRLPFAPDHALFCWDGHSKTDKPRGPKPEGFLEDLERFQDMLPLIVGGAHCTPDGEADDAVATAAFRFAERKVHCCVVSGDKDLHQLVGPYVHYYCLNKKEELTEAAIRARWHVHYPVQVAVALAMLGDRNDGIAGVYGVGPVAVQRIFSKVPPDADLAETIDTVASLLRADQVPDFVASLEATLLSVEVKDVPEPKPIVLADAKTFDSFKVGTAAITWARLLGRVELHRDASSSADASE